MKYTADRFKKDIASLNRSGGLREFYTIFREGKGGLVLDKNKLVNIFKKYGAKLKDVSVKYGDRIEFSYSGKLNPNTIPKLQNGILDMNDEYLNEFVFDYVSQKGEMRLRDGVKVVVK